ncbi:hypothetical protein [Klebsiella pneumoniae]|uniref:hypothetical protein n=1 Tax=Klebsiella pneumoniae TaxID=573 RepID=UPI00223E7E7B|nr:hypothetical protein [Klebsiella pneumoniae]
MELCRDTENRRTRRRRRTHLHQITGAFMTADAQKRRGHCLRWNEGDESALAAALSLHASTRERLPGADEIDARFAVSARRVAIWPAG